MLLGFLLQTYMTKSIVDVCDAHSTIGMLTNILHMQETLLEGKLSLQCQMNHNLIIPISTSLLKQRIIAWTSTLAL